MAALAFGLKLLAELLLLFVLISTLIYLVLESLTASRIQRLLGGASPLFKLPMATLLGAVAPFCTCSTVPLINGMRLAGIPTAPLVAFLTASPLINPVAIVLLWTTIGPAYAVLYTAAALLLAALGGVAVAHWGPSIEAVARNGPDVTRCGSTDAGEPLCEPQLSAVYRMATLPGNGGTAGQPLAAIAALALPVVATESLVARLARAVQRTLTDLKKLALPLVAAVALGALVHDYAPADLIVRAAGPEAPWAVPAAALLGVPVYGSVVVLLPLASTLLAKGVGIGAVTAFLMGASGFSLPELILLSRILPASLLVRVLVVFTLAVVGIGFLFQLLVG